jgi:hypothetical protein
MVSALLSSIFSLLIMLKVVPVHLYNGSSDKDMFLSIDFVSTSVEACRAYGHPLMLQVLLLSKSFQKRYGCSTTDNFERIFYTKDH